MEYLQDLSVLKEEVTSWQRRMQKRPSIINRMTRHAQQRINRAIPEKVQVITGAIRQMVRAILFGSKLITSKPVVDASLLQRDARAVEIIRQYRATASAEGAVTGAGGILIGLADFPLWLSIKVKMLMEIASTYGFDVSNYKERLYVLHIFQLTFSTQQTRRVIYERMANWKEYQASIPDDPQLFDWRTFQQEYRDYIDLAKLFQLIPGIGAAVGAIVNYRLTGKLGTNAMNAFRMRVLEERRA